MTGTAEQEKPAAATSHEIASWIVSLGGVRTAVEGRSTMRAQEAGARAGLRVFEQAIKGKLKLP